MIRSFLRLIRLPNLIIVVLTQLTIRYLVIGTVFNKSDVEFSLQAFPFWLMVLATVLTAAGGYVINDYHDTEIDRVNCPERLVLSKDISRQHGYILAVVLMSLALISGILMSFYIGKPFTASIYLVAVLFTWWYAVQLKRKYLTGNIMVALLTALSTALPMFFEWILTTPYFRLIEDWHRIFLMAGAAVIFAALLNLAREIIKDIEDVEGDSLAGCRTIPVISGINTAKWFVLTVSLIVLALLFLSQVFLISWSCLFSALYLLIAEILFVYAIYLLRIAQKKADYHRLSSIIKFIMVAGISTLVILHFEY